MNFARKFVVIKEIAEANKLGANNMLVDLFVEPYSRQVLRIFGRSCIYIPCYLIALLPSKYWLKKKSWADFWIKKMIDLEARLSAETEKLKKFALKDAPTTENV